MKYLLTIILFIICTTSVVFADEKVDSLNYYLQLADSAYEADDLEEERNYHECALGFYLNEHDDVSQDTVYAFLLEQYGDICNRIEDYEAAIEALTEASQIYKSVFGESHPDYARSLNQLAIMYSNCGDNHEAIRIGTENLENAKNAFGTNHLNYATSLTNIALFYSNIGDYLNAIKFGTEAMIIRKQALGNKHPDYALSLQNLAKYYAGSGNYNDAIRLEHNVMEIYKNTFGSKHIYYAMSLQDLADYYSKSGEQQEAIKFATKAKNIIRKTYGKESPNYALQISRLAGYYAEIRDYSSAIRLGLEDLRIMKNMKEKAWDEWYSEYILSLNNLATYYGWSGNYNEAIRLGEDGIKEMAGHKEVLESPHYAQLLLNLSHCYADKGIGDFSKAVSLGTQALEIQKTVLGEEHPDYAQSLNDIALYYSNLDNFDEAFRLEFEALTIRKDVLGEDHLDYANSLQNLASIYFHTGNYPEAIRLCSQVVEIKKKLLGTKNISYAEALKDLAVYNNCIGNYEESIRLGHEVMEITKSQLGRMNPNYSSSLINLALYYHNLGRFNEAIQLEKEAKQIIKKTQGSNTFDYAWLLNNLANDYSGLGDFEKAVDLLKEALVVRQNLYGKDNPRYANSLTNLASAYYDLGNYNEAIQLGVEALEIRKRINVNNLKDPNNDIATSIENLALYYSETGNYEKAIPLIKEYLSLVRNDVLWTFSGLTSNERRMYFDKHNYALNYEIPKLIIHSNTPDAATLLYDNTALFAKGLLLSTEIEMTKLIQESNDEDAWQLYSELQKMRQLLNAQYSMPINERQLDCDSLEYSASTIERQLVFRVKELGDYSRNLGITWRDIQKKLREDDIAIEFLSYLENDTTYAYAALTLCKNDSLPILTSLFTDDEIIDAAGSDDTYHTSMADSLIWAPLYSRLKGKSHVYFSASGLLHNIGIEYLPSMEGIDCHRLSSTRELVTHQPSSSIESATLYGDIDYNASYTSIIASTPSRNEYFAFTSRSGLFSGHFNYRSLRYGVNPLPSTRAEIQDVSTSLQSLGLPYETLSGTQASEESFKALSGQRKTLLHISTHGFYYDAEDVNAISSRIRMTLMGDERPNHYEDQSMLRCGLCFAGANQILSGESEPSIGQEDGILNALEIAQTDLRGLDLVVLSACQTALGDVVNGEGVFGLQRGFKKAGAQSILMSLWEVDDDVTQLLMTEFYRGWTSGMTKTAALRNAQAVIKEKYPDPHDWAAFILLDALD